MPEPEHGPGDLQRLGERVRTERIARGWSKQAAARHAKMSSITWKRVEDGLGVHDTTYAAISAVFDWKPTGCHRILSNLEPEPLQEAGDDGDQAPSEDVAALVAQLQEQGVAFDALNEDDLRLLAAYAKALSDRSATGRNRDHPNRRVS